jgi:alkanesulfonate monooxygenase SsuD/methylene tetrahydromethanopterin reductase-like flavin-dependent oxidoreductase (luciferase family)
MTRVRLTYDLVRAPADAPARPDHAALYTAMLEQVSWADAHGFDAVCLGEHHGASNGYLCSPIVAAAAAAGRSRRLGIRLTALILPLHDPVRAAEDLATLDLASAGRLLPVIGAGHQAAEFEAVGKRIGDRARLVEAYVAVLRRAWSGEPFEWEGRRRRVTPRPCQDPLPIWLGGNSEAAARRAARIADGFMPAMPGLFETYRAECQRLGRTACTEEVGLPLFYLGLAEDPDDAWAKLGPYLLGGANFYMGMVGSPADPESFRAFPNAEALRASGMVAILTPDECVERARALGPRAVLTLWPLFGGTPPELAWPSIELMAKQVIPRLAPEA